MASDEIRARAEAWLADDFDETTRAELRQLLERGDDISGDLGDRFAGELTFGTAGLRAELGAGSNRMNRAVAARATFGLAEVLVSSVPGALERGVVIGGDARRWSREMSEDAAAILGALGFRVTLFPVAVPTPVVAYAVKFLQAAAGIVITASHNPARYNGYKVYWEGGLPLGPPLDVEIAAAMARAPAARRIVRPSLAELAASGKLEFASEQLAESYLTAIGGLGVHPGVGERLFRIVLTAMHGVGDSWARRALAAAGFTDVLSVPEQQQPDGAFPTVAFPNPEEPEALDVALSLARQVKADLVLANDPDADRLAVAVPVGDQFRRLTGNEVGLLLGHYLMTEMPRDRPLAVVTTVASSPAMARMATALGVRCEETLSGFKWIVRRARELESEGYRVVLGFEEAIGYAVGDVVRDKDGISAAVVVSELAAVLRARGLTLVDQLAVIGARFGFSASTLVNITRSGPGGASELEAMMERLRANPPESVAGDPVVAIVDYLAGVTWVPNVGVAERLTVPRGRVLSLKLASGSRIVVRPSGTEPKVKIYFDVFAPPELGLGSADVDARLQRLVAAFVCHVSSK
jgi:phosphomannomutase